ncbi:cell envelope integrity protein CreD [Flavobacterium okayamense]|uniref:Cell envelope integrity protein CreD n=1 Tax=Flavobacterium okayamense TaxID=2830782 RepID=A0ABM7SDW5_9FLAO|nr:cell envelope integrity protein CreD [Flavobacterium okayamense]BCY29397.1 cell envelope integrity protein CreD [Flavobacterium okayamense]
MENQTEKETFERSTWFQTNTAKMMMVGILTLVLLIPLTIVQDLIKERSERKNEATIKVTNSWGDNINLMGPILKVPYKIYSQTEEIDEKTKEKTIKKYSYTQNAYFFPFELNHTTKVDKVDKLKLGLYKPIVFKANVGVNGNFKELNFEKLGIKPENVLWDKATIQIRTSNLKSIKSDLFIKLNGDKYTLETNGESKGNFDVLETKNFNLDSITNLDFNFDIQYNGSNSIEFIPIGKTTKTSIDANWNSPSFIGSYAPLDTTKNITNKSFHADWKLIHVNRPFAQQYSEKIPNLNEYSYGAKLIETVDQYQQNERASKYGFLVIGLTFLIFFLIQTISKINIHIFQYTMIGLALIMFYTLLISITEHSSFMIAYSIAASSVIVMLLLYSISVLKNKKFPLFITAALTLLYSFIYVIIQLEDYALLVGSIGLFLILAAVMYFSRKIDWSKN